MVTKEKVLEALKKFGLLPKEKKTDRYCSSSR